MYSIKKFKKLGLMLCALGAISGLEIRAMNEREEEWTAPLVLCVNNTKSKDFQSNTIGILAFDTNPIITPLDDEFFKTYLKTEELFTHTIDNKKIDILLISEGKLSNNLKNLTIKDNKYMVDTHYLGAFANNPKLTWYKIGTRTKTDGKFEYTLTIDAPDYIRAFTALDKKLKMLNGLICDVDLSPLKTKEELDKEKKKKTRLPYFKNFANPKEEPEPETEIKSQQPEESFKNSENDNKPKNAPENLNLENLKKTENLGFDKRQADLKSFSINNVVNNPDSKLTNQFLSTLKTQEEREKEKLEKEKLEKKEEQQKPIQKQEEDKLENEDETETPHSNSRKDRFALPTLSIPNVLRAAPSAILTAIVASFYTHATNEVPWCKEHWYLTFAGFGPGFVAAKWLGNKISGKDAKQKPCQVITPAFIGTLVGGYVGRTFGAPVAKLVCQKVGGWIGAGQLAK